MVATLITALLVFWLAYDDATFGLVARSSLAIAIWWAIALTVAAGMLRLPAARWFWTTAGFLGAFAAWTAASLAWGVSNERAFNEFNRVALYLGVYVLAALVAGRARPIRWADGLALGIMSVGFLALAARFFPDLFPSGELGRYFSGPQLSYPVEYVNGLAILLALSLPLLLSAVVSERALLVRATALAPVPALAAAIYLTSSRGGVIVAATGVVVFAALTTRRWSAAGAVAVSVAASAATIAVLLDRPALVDEPLTQAAEDQGPGAAVLIAAICIATGLTYAAGIRVVGDRGPAPALGWISLVVAVALVSVGVAAADPVEKFETFREPPSNPTVREQEYSVRGHLLSANSTGRWQFWKAATEQFEQHPVAGDGAGSYEAWWARHGSFPIFVTDAHSLYLEVLGELGLIGLLLLLAAIATAGIGAIGRTGTAIEPDRTAYAGLTACFLALVVGAGIDWMWEFTVVSVVGLAALGFVVGHGPTTRRSAQDDRRWIAARVGLPVVAVVVILSQAIPLLASLEIRESQAAVRRGDATEALNSAERARDVQPWAASPHLQVALVEEEMNRLALAKAAIRQAIDRDRTDWRLWLVRARLETKTGEIRAARRSLRRAATLNPRSPLFARPAA
jgi:hypothetical protein